MDEFNKKIWKFVEHSHTSNLVRETFVFAFLFVTIKLPWGKSTENKTAAIECWGCLLYYREHLISQLYFCLCNLFLNRYYISNINMRRVLLILSSRLCSLTHCQFSQTCSIHQRETRCGWPQIHYWPVTFSQISLDPFAQLQRAVLICLTCWHNNLPQALQSCGIWKICSSKSIGQIHTSSKKKKLEITRVGLICAQHCISRLCVEIIILNGLRW